MTTTSMLCVSPSVMMHQKHKNSDIVDEQFRADYIPWKWSIAVSVGVDNTN